MSYKAEGIPPSPNISLQFRPHNKQTMLDKNYANVIIKVLYVTTYPRSTFGHISEM